MKPAQAKAIITDCEQRGWIWKDGTLYSPESARALGLDGETMSSTEKNKNRSKGLKSASIKTGWIDDTRNLKNKDKQTEFFDRLVKMELNLEIWHEFRFSTERNYRIDKAIPVDAKGNVLKIAVEINGGIWKRGKSGHSSGTGIKRDMDKANLLTANGWRLIEVEPSDIKDRPAYVIDLIKKLL